MAFLSASGRFVLPLRRSERRVDLSAVPICPMMEFKGIEATRDIPEETLERREMLGERHSDMKVWILHLGLSHLAVFLLAKSSGKLYFIFPLT